MIYLINYLPFIARALKVNYKTESYYKLKQYFINYLQNNKDNKIDYNKIQKMTNFIDYYSQSSLTASSNSTVETSKQKPALTSSISQNTTLQSEIKQLKINQISQHQQHPSTLFSSFPSLDASKLGNNQQLKQKIMHAVDRTCLRDCVYTEINNNIYFSNKEQNNYARNHHRVQVYGIHQNFGNFLYFDLLCKINFIIDLNTIAFCGILLKNFIPYRVIGKDNRITISKFILKVNSMLKYGSVRIDPNTGQLSINLSNIFSYEQFILILQQSHKLQNYLQQQLQKIKYFITLILPRILYLQNQLPSTYLDMNQFNQFDDTQINNNNNGGFSLTKISNYFKQTERKFNKIASIMQMECPFMFADHVYTGSKKITVQGIKKMNDIIKGSKIIKKNIHKDIIKVISMIIGKQKLRNIQKIAQNDNISQSDKKQFANRLMQPMVRYPNGQIPSLYSQIQIVSANSNWQVIDQGGFGLISKSLTKFIFKPSIQKSSSSSQPQSQSSLSLSLSSIPMPVQNNVFSKQLVRKQDSEQDIKKLPHQKTILSTLKNLTCPFIAKFYCSEQPAYKNSLFLQYCVNKSLCSLKHHNKQFLSLSTKLQYLKNIAQAIKFLKDNQINHLDLKPSNILISSGYAKLTDFGQSYHPSICPKNFRPGTSIPYAPPQVFTNSLINFNSKIDVFSLGVILYQLIFECYPFDYSKLRYEMYKKSYVEKDYRKFMFIAPEKIMKRGNKSILSVLVYISMRAMEEDEKKRPCIQWILIMIDLCIGALTDIMIAQA